MKALSTLKQTYKRTLYKLLFFFTKAPIMLNDFNLIMEISMDQSFEVFWDSSNSDNIFLFKKCKNQRFWRKKNWLLTFLTK